VIENTEAMSASHAARKKLELSIAGSSNSLIEKQPDITVHVRLPARRGKKSPGRKGDSDKERAEGA